MYTYICSYCLISFQHHKKDKKFCSMDCVKKSKTDNRKAICNFCQQEFLKNSINEKRNYCSKACSNSATKRNRIVVNCGWCKKEFEKNPGDLGKEHNFCNENCFHFHLRNGQEKSVEKQCKNCKKDFEVFYADREQEFCSKSCSKTGEFHHFYGKEGPTKGMKPWTYGLTKETNKKIATLSEKVSETHKKQFVEGIRNNAGENNPNWKLPEERKTPVYEAIRHCEFYIKWRFSVFERDNFTCVLCKDNTKFINADHIKQFALIINENNIKTLEDAYLCTELWDINNGRTLCVECHKNTDTYGYKGRLEQLKC